jgi:hypothetical protein
MIPRKQTNGEMLLVTQTDHSRLAGQFAAHWGNAEFASLQPYESVARAAAFHDFGYLRYETAPAFVPESGETPLFRNVLTDAQRLEEYEWCSEWLMGLDPYAGLLVNMHRTGLWRQRYNTIASAMQNHKQQKPVVEDFIARYEAARPERIAEIGADPKQLWTNYRLLQVWDLMSLYFSCDAPEREHVIEPVPTGYGDAENEGVRMTMTPIDATSIAVDPYPFDVATLRVSLPARRFAQSKFESQDAFRKAYFRAPLMLLEYDLKPAGNSTARPAGSVLSVAGAS